MTYQLVIPDDYRHNIAEKSIQTWKDHFVGVINGIATTFPHHLWCQAIPQSELQLMLLRQTNINPKISTYSHVYGQHDYSTHPFLPIGMETLVHDKPRRKKTFSEHCSKGYVLGTSFEHYRAWEMWMTKSKDTRVSGKLFHKHKYITNHDVTPEDRVIAAMSELYQEISGRECKNRLSNTTLDQLTRLGEILKKRIEDGEEQDQKTQQSIVQTIRRSARIAAGNGLPVPRKLSNPTVLFRPPAAAAAPPRVPTTASPTTYFESGLPTATPPRVQPP